MKRYLLLLTVAIAIPACSDRVGKSLIDYVDTRVGTDANAIYTEGRFGKGSEEYGQTLPAVLEPNGMNFWTAQTSH